MSAPAASAQFLTSPQANVNLVPRGLGRGRGLLVPAWQARAPQRLYSDSLPRRSYLDGLPRRDSVLPATQQQVGYEGATQEAHDSQQKTLPEFGFHVTTQMQEDNEM